MTNQQKDFLRLCVIEQLKYKEITRILGVPNSTLSLWYEELKAERIAIASVRTLWTRKKIDIPFPDFYKWYLSNERKCKYCEITESEINELVNNGKLETKRLKTRGRKLELERKQPNEEYNKIDNLTFACYWCNNAKTDTFTEKEFHKVGAVFKEIWKNRLQK